jgi:hypothetical protein
VFRNFVGLANYRRRWRCDAAGVRFVGEELARWG